MIGSELTIQLLVLRFFAGLIIATVQGAALAGVAVLLGDQGPRHDRRLTLLPFVHVDLLGLGSLILTGFGWGRPVAIDAGQVRYGRWGLVLAVLASSLALLAVAYLILFLVIPLLTLLPFTAGIGAAACSAAHRCVAWPSTTNTPRAPPLGHSTKS